jgi:hypothetical protein
MFRANIGYDVVIRMIKILTHFIIGVYHHTYNLYLGISFPFLLLHTERDVCGLRKTNNEEMSAKTNVGTFQILASTRFI